MKKRIKGILQLYWFPPDGFASTTADHIEAFGKYSQFDRISWNTAYGFPEQIKNYEFDIVLFHYSLFGGPIYWLDDRWQDYILSMTDTLKIAFFQDEYRHWGIRYLFLENWHLDIVYTCFESQYHNQTYYRNGWKGKVIHTLTGYVDDRLVQLGQHLGKPDHSRTVDIGYRARKGDEYMGKGAWEKHEIGKFFLTRLSGSGFNLDIALGESSRINGDDWYGFLGNAKACLGVESGVSIVDLDDVLWPCWRAMKHTDATPIDQFEFSALVGLENFENMLPLRTVSPRHFEAAALGTCQILFRGEYSGVLKADRHYIALEKDYSNFDHVIELFTNPNVRRQITTHAYADLIASRRYDYSTFMKGFDREIKARGYTPKKGTLPFTALKASVFEEKKSRMDDVQNGGKWFGPDAFPRPNWPQNHLDLRKLTAAEIWHKLTDDLKLSPDVT